jgi:hypothetical protein
MMVCGDRDTIAMTKVHQSMKNQSIKFTTRVPGNPGSLEENLSITRVVKSRVIWTHYLLYLKPFDVIMFSAPLCEQILKVSLH